MEQLVYYLLIILVIFAIGFTYVLLSNQMKRSWIPISFTIGAVILILAAFWISYFSRKGLRLWADVVMLVLLLSSVAVYIWKRKKIAEYAKMITRGDFISLCFCIGAGGLPMALYIIYGAEFPYCDGFTYVCIADYLMDNGYNVSISSNEVLMHPWLTQMMLYQTCHFRIGAQMLLSLFSCLFRVENSIELFLPLTAFGVMWIGMSVWQLIEENYHAGVKEKIVAVSIVCFNAPIVLWNAMYGFFPQIFGSALFVAGIASFLHCEKWQENWHWNIIVTSIITGCLALTYNELLPFLVLVVLTIVIAKIISEKADIKVIIGNVFLCGILAIITIIVYFPGMIMAVLHMMKVAVGWNQEKGLMTYLSYFFSIVPVEYSYRNSALDEKFFLYEAVSLIVFAVVILGYRRSERMVRREYAYVSLSFLIMFLWFVFFTENPFDGNSTNTWSVFKMMQYYFVIAAPFIALFLCECFNSLKKCKFLFPLFILCFVLYCSNNAVSYAHTLAQEMIRYVGNDEEPLEEYHKLYQKYGEYDGIISLYDVPAKHRQMIAYYLKDVNLISDWESDGYLNMPCVDANIITSQDNMMTLTYVGDTALEKNRIIVPSYQESIANMVEVKACITFVEGVYEEETNGIETWRWCEDRVTLDVHLYDEVKEGTVEFEVCPVSHGGSKLIACDEFGNVISETPLSTTEFTTISVPISSDNANASKVNISFEGEKPIISDADTRNLVFLTRDWKVNWNE